MELIIIIIIIRPFNARFITRVQTLCSFGLCGIISEFCVVAMLVFVVH